MKSSVYEYLCKFFYDFDIIIIQQWLALVGVSIAVKNHHDHVNSYKRKQLGCLFVV